MEGKELAVIILAAGKGSRMKSPLVKALHPLASRPLLAHVLESVARLDPERTIVVTGHQGDKVRAAFTGPALEFVEQKEQLGTGHAVSQAGPALGDFQGTVLVLCCDMPFLKFSTLRQLIAKHHETKAQCTLLSLKTGEEKDFGRVVRDGEGAVLRIVENCDASPAEKMIDEFNSGVYCFDKKLLFNALGATGDRNAQNEIYLTDTIQWMRKKHFHIESVQTEDSMEIFGINSAEDLKLAELRLQG